MEVAPRALSIGGVSHSKQGSAGLSRRLSG
jgi:hypothetical protein